MSTCKSCKHFLFRQHATRELRINKLDVCVHPTMTPYARVKGSPVVSPMGKCGLYEKGPVLKVRVKKEVGFTSMEMSWK